MLEAKAKDLALIRLRNDIGRYAPELASRYNITVADALEEEPEIAVEAEPDQESDTESPT